MLPPLPMMQQMDYWQMAGDREDQQALIEHMNERTGGENFFMEYLDEEMFRVRHTQAEQERTEQQQRILDEYVRLTEAGGEESSFTTRVTRDPEVMVGRYGEEEQEVNVGDLEEMARNPLTTGITAPLVHEGAEAAAAQLRELPYDPAHAVGQGAETRALGGRDVESITLTGNDPRTLVASTLGEDMRAVELRREPTGGIDIMEAGDSPYLQRLLWEKYGSRY